MSSKEAVLEAVRQLPDEVSIEEIIDHLEIIAAIRKAEEAADAGRVVSQDDVRKRIASWITK